MTLKPCPCGKTPTELFISGQHDQDKWPTVMGSDCCGEWEIKFKNPNHLDVASRQVKELGLEAWNDAPRPTDTVTIPRAEYDRMVRMLEEGVTYEDLRETEPENPWK